MENVQQTKPPLASAPDDSSKSHTRIEVTNKTPRRIAIKSCDPDDFGNPEYLFISPFGTKVLSEDAIQKYECGRWKQEDLVDVRPMEESADAGAAALSAGIGCGFWLVVYLAIAMLVDSFRESSFTWILFAVLIVTGSGLAIHLAGGFNSIKIKCQRAGRSILQYVNLILVLAVVSWLGAWLFYQFSGGRELAGKSGLSLEDLGRVIQYLFMGIATLLPALMYFLFNRRLREKVQDNFIREVLRLDPGIRTISEAESKYRSLIQETFGTTHASAFLLTSGLPILLCTLLIFMGWLLVLQPFTEATPIDTHQLENLLLPRANAVTFAFLGVYFFAVSLIFRRYVRADLTPKTYTSIILRLLLAIILAWTLSALPMFADASEADGEASGLLYLLAFFVGIFPETGVTVLRDLARNPFFTSMFPRLEEEHPLTRLDGINLYDRSRFMEEGIENIENLAHHSLIGLILSTRISTNRLVDMFDQAILYLHLGQEPDEVAAVRKQLRAYGIRTATDLEEAYKCAVERAEKHGGKEIDKFLMIINGDNPPSDSLSRIQTILDTLRDDDWMTYLRHWRELSQRNIQTFTLKGVSLVEIEEDVQQSSAMTL